MTFPAGGAGAETDEAELVRRAVVDAAATAALYQRYVGRVYRFLRVRCSSSDEAADLTQQVLLKMTGALPRYRERGAPFAAWLFRIARNVAIDGRGPGYAYVTRGFVLRPEGWGGGALCQLDGEDFECSYVLVEPLLDEDALHVDAMISIPDREPCPPRQHCVVARDGKPFHVQFDGLVLPLR